MVASDFIAKWGSKVKHTPYSECLFRCLVSYTSNKVNCQEETVARIYMDGMEAGKVSLDETGELSVDSFHLDFFPRYQTYQLGSKENLVVSGSSDKMQGAYTVEIQPIQAVDPKKHYSADA